MEYTYVVRHSLSMHTQHVIEQLGYRPNEAKVYLAALSLGEARVSAIAAKVKLPRSSVRMYIDTLHKNGLMNFYMRRHHACWVAENPERLLARLREREAEVRAALPRLLALRHGENVKLVATVFEGVEEIKSVYDDMIETRQPIRGIVPWDDWMRLLGVEFMEDFVERRVRHYLRIRLLTPQTSATKALRTRDSAELRQTRFIPKHLHIGSTTFIYGTKVAIISLAKKLPTAVLLDDSDVRDTIALFFEELWGNSQYESRPLL